ncbi:hypothetical protein, partial [Mesorhizobium sp.]|uniref:hypothetical protein n=1 Tax=Mesorhizobium sp. TaxID=1871066 RepID=UPI0025CCD103
MAKVTKRIISPLEEEMAGRPERGASRQTSGQEAQSAESVAASYSTKTFTLAARPAASITVSV